jgi:glycosidase
MPILSSFLRSKILLVLSVLTFAAPIRAQTLARPGWVGSGMGATAWWKHAVVYRVDPRTFGGLHGVTEQLGYIRSLGTDALLLSSLGGDAQNILDPAMGTMDDVDEIVRQASQLNIRVLVELDATSANLTAKARSWLVHGIAGFYAAKANAAQLAEFRTLANSFAGQRIVVGDLETAGTQNLPQLVADPRPGTQATFEASTIRPVLEATQQIAEQGRSAPLLLSDGPAWKRSMSRYGNGSQDVAIAKSLAMMLMTTRAGAMLFAGQELGLVEGTKEISFVPPKKGEPPTPRSVAAEDATQTSLLNWYRQLSALVHSNRTINAGAITILNHDDQNVLAWVRRPPVASLATPAIVVIENLSAQPVTLSLKAEIEKLHLRGSFLRSLLRSDNGMGALHLNGMTLAPHMAFIGELRY